MQPHQPKESLLAQASTIGPFTSWLAEKLWMRAAREACWDCQQLLCFARSFSASRLEAAIARLLYYGVEDLSSLRFVLEQDLDHAARRYDADLDGQLHLPLDNPQL
jgi:hypothetical protein